MSESIGLTDIKLEYATIAEARAMSGLRLVLGAYPVPGPWREACKGIFHVKGIPYTPVRTAGAGYSDLDFGADGADAELRAWTAQSSAPVAIWNDERPRVHWIDQLYLAERLNPEPHLIPPGIDDQIRMFGLAHQVAGEGGLGWTKRIAMVHRALESLPADDPGRGLWKYIGEKYFYTPALGSAAPGRMAEIIATLHDQLKAQRDHGRRYFIGHQISALDIYWACFLAMFEPLPPELCPMADFPYSNPDPEVAAVLSPLLREHRDYIYESYLELPLVF